MDAGQDTMADFEPGRFRALPRQRLGRIEGAASHDADPAVGDFSATLLAMAGHDLRQPLQIITSAHDVLALTLDSEEQREELTRAAEATAELASMLGQLVEALQLRERSDEDLHVPVRLRPVLAELAAEFAEMARSALRLGTAHLGARHRRRHPRHRAVGDLQCVSASR